LADSFIESKSIHLAKLKEIELREREKKEKKPIIKDGIKIVINVTT
jgi:hypothetical protein